MFHRKNMEKYESIFLDFFKKLVLKLKIKKKFIYKFFDIKKNNLSKKYIYLKRLFLSD